MYPERSLHEEGAFSQIISRTVKLVLLKAGRTPGAQPEAITTTPITVFVGPNNSGKSKVLAEIDQYCRTGTQNRDGLLIQDIQFESVDQATAETKIQDATLEPLKNETPQPDYLFVGKGGIRHKVHGVRLLAALQSPNDHPTQFCEGYLCYNTEATPSDDRSHSERMALIQTSGADDDPRCVARLHREIADRHREAIRRIRGRPTGSDAHRRWVTRAG